MTPVHKKTLIGSILLFVGAFFLSLAGTQVLIALRSIRGFSFCVVGPLGLACAVVLGVIGLGALVAGMVIMHPAPK